MKENNTFKSKYKNLKLKNYILHLMFLFLLAIVLYNSHFNFVVSFFYIFPLIGFTLSIAALKKIFGISSNTLLDKICTVNDTNNCSQVVNSKHWRLLKTVDFSDLSITFFSTQIIGLLIMGFSQNYSDYFFIQTISLITSVPVILLSIYYQKFVERKWCIICLLISTTLIIQLVYILINFKFTNYEVDWTQGIKYLFIYFSTFMAWRFIKQNLREISDLRVVEIEANKFRRDYTNFKNNLISSSPYDIPKEFITLENLNNESLNLTIFTNPYCGACKYTHGIVNQLIEKYGQKLTVTFLFNYNLGEMTEDIRLLLRNLVNIGIKKPSLINDALNSWFKHKNLEQWISKYGSSMEVSEIDEILKSQMDWCKDNKSTYTPCLFIGNYRYPLIYDNSDLLFFMDGLIEDFEAEKLNSLA